MKKLLVGLPLVALPLVSVVSCNEQKQSVDQPQNLQPVFRKIVYNWDYSNKNQEDQRVYTHSYEKDKLSMTNPYLGIDIPEIIDTEGILDSLNLQQISRANIKLLITLLNMQAKGRTQFVINFKINDITRTYQTEGFVSWYELEHFLTSQGWSNQHNTVDMEDPFKIIISKRN